MVYLHHDIGMFVLGQCVEWSQQQTGEAPRVCIDQTAQDGFIERVSG